MARRVGDVLSAARDRLGAATAEAPLREAVLLLARTLETTEAHLLAHPERALSADEERRIEGVLRRRLTGEPVAYLLGEREFWGRTFAVDRRVLVPRPETEQLVEAALRLAPRAARFVDIGTGSGCIAITVALERPDLRVVASDVSPAALVVARANRIAHRAPVVLACGDLMSPLRPPAVDIVVANLPYVALAELAAAAPDVRDFEPTTALLAADGGLAVIRRLLAQCRALHPASLVLLEIGSTQAEAAIRIAAEYHLRLVEKLRDYAGHDRNLIFAVP